MSRRRVIITICLATLCGLTVSIFWSAAKRSPSYLAFTEHRSPEYYSEFAQACDKLIVTVRPTAAVTELRGDDPRMPPILKAIEPSHVEVGTNRVWLVMEPARYGVVWGPEDSDPKIWHLTAHAGAGPVLLFTKRN